MYLELGLNIHGWKNHDLTTVSAARPQNSLRAPCCAQHEEKRKLKGPRTHIRRHWSARHRHARASTACSLVRAYLESETTAPRFHLEIRLSGARARWVAGRSIWARQRAPRQWTWLENVQKVLQFIWISRAFDSRHRGNISHLSSWANSFCIEYKSQERNSLGSDIIYF